MTTAMQSQLHIDQTQAFINQNPTTVMCLRQERTDTGTGGYVLGAWVPQGDRQVRVVGQGVTHPRVTPDGRTVVPVASAIVMPEEDWLVGDRLESLGINYEIVFIDSLPPWRMRMELISYA